MKYFISILIALLIYPLISPPAYALWWMVYHKPAFKGKIIDAETKDPIEGAVVAVTYSKTSAMGIVESYSVIVDVKETITDKNGEFYIPAYTTIIQPFSWEEWARFIIFKPGYGSFHSGYPSYHKFIIWALPEGLGYSYTLSEILKRKVEEKWREEFEEFKKEIEKKGKKTYFTKKVEDYLPVIPMKDSQERLRKLDIPYVTLPDDIDIENIKWLYRFDMTLEEESNYWVIGLPKLETREERLNSVRSADLKGEVPWEKIKNLMHLINEEYKNLGVTTYKEGD